MRGPTSGNKLSPSPLKDNVQRYHNNQIRSRSRDASSENQFSPPHNVSQQPMSANPHSAAPLSQNETAKNNPHSERNLVEEYRQKLRSKLSETASNQHNQSQLSHNQRPPSYGLPNQNQGQASNLSAPLETGHPLRLSPTKVQAQHEMATRLGQTTGSHQNQAMEGIRERYGNQLDHLQARGVSPPPTKEWNPGYSNPLQYNSQVTNPLQGSSGGPSAGLKQSDNSSMQSVYNRIQNLRQSILNQESAPLPTVSTSQKTAGQAYDDFQNQLRDRTPSPAIGLNHTPTHLQTQPDVNAQQELSPMMYSMADSQNGTQTKGRRRSIENSSIQVDHSFEQRLRAEMEQQFQQRLTQIDFENQKGSDQRYQELQSKFDNLLGQFNQLQAHIQAQQQVPQFAVAELSRGYQSSQGALEQLRQDQQSRNSEPQHPSVKVSEAKLQSVKVSEPKLQSYRETEQIHHISQKASSKEKVELVQDRRSSSGGHFKSETHPVSGNLKNQSHQTSGNHKTEGSRSNGPSRPAESCNISNRHISEGRQASGGNVKTQSHHTSGQQISEFNQESGKQISESRHTSQQLPPARSGRQQSSHATSLIQKDLSQPKHSQTMHRNSSKSRQRSSSQNLIQGTKQGSNQDIDEYTFTESEVQKLHKPNDTTRNQGNVGLRETMDTNQHRNRDSPDHPSTKGPFSATFDKDSQQQNINQNQQVVVKFSQKSLTNRESSSQSLNSTAKQNLLSLDLMIMPEQPKPIQTYISTHDSKTITTPTRSLHTKRFQYKATMKVDVKNMDYQDFSKVGYFANKDLERKESIKQIKKDMPGDKRIILELKRQVKALNIANKKLLNQVENTKERLLTEGGQACCCQELKGVMIHKNTQMLNIIEVWKQKASEQGHFWALQVRDLAEEHQKSCSKYKGQLQQMAEQQNSIFGMIINKQEELEMQYQSRLDAKEKDNRELTKRVVQHRHALVQLRLNEL